MKKNSLYGKFKVALTTVALSAAVFAFAPFSAFATLGGTIDYVAETVTTANVTGDSKLATEYTINGGATWLPIYGAAAGSKLDISSIIPEPGKPAATIVLRANNTVTYAEAFANTADKGLKISIPARPKATGLIYTATKGTLKHTTGATMTIDAGLNEISLANNVESTVFIPTATVVVKYTLPAVASNSFKTGEGTLTVPAAPKVPAVVFDDKTNSLTKTTIAMEYNIDASQTSGWLPCKNGFTDLSQTAVTATKVGVRYKSTVSSAPSPIASFTVTTASGTAPVPTTNFILDWNTERIKYVTAPDLEVSSNDGLTWTTIPKSTGYSFSALLKPYSLTTDLTSKIWVRTKATASASSSKIFKVTLKERPATPAATVATVVYTSGMTLAATHSYTVSPNTASSTWQDGGGSAVTFAAMAPAFGPSATADNIFGKTLDIKLKGVVVGTPDATAGTYTPASLPVKFKLANVSAAPAVAYTGLKGGTYGALTGFRSGLEYGTASSFTNPVSTGATAEVMTLRSVDLGKDIYVRTAATSTAPASAAKIIKVPTTPEIQAGTVSFEPYTCTLLGANSTLEYKITGEPDTAWKVYTNTNFKATLAPKYDSVEHNILTTVASLKVDIRVKGTAVSPISDTTVVTLK